MSDAERRAFLTEGTRTGKLATARKDGRPHVAPVWFVLDDQDRIVFTTGATTLKGKALRRDPRVGMAVDDQTPPYSFVVIDGVAELSADLDDMLVWATRIAGRYMGLDKAEVYGRRNAVEGELLVRLTPDHIVAEKDIAL